MGIVLFDSQLTWEWLDHLNGLDLELVHLDFLSQGQ